LDAGQASLQSIHSLQTVAESDTDITQDCRVTQITLVSADWQLLSEVGEQADRHAQVTFGILEVNGVDLVGHGGAADFAGHVFLSKVAKRNVHPHVA